MRYLLFIVLLGAVFTAGCINTTPAQIFVIPHRFSIVDYDGRRFEKEPYHGSEWLMAGELCKNQYKKGKVLFEIPQNSKDLILYYDMNGKIFSWKIN